MNELVELLSDWHHWAFEIISGGVFFVAGLIVPERFNPVKRLVSRHDRKHHMSEPEQNDVVEQVVHRIQAFTGGEHNVGVTRCGYLVDSPNTPHQVGQFTVQADKVTCLACLKLSAPLAGKMLLSARPTEHGS